MKQSALFFLLVTHFSIAVNAQYEWRMNSAGRYVYEKTVIVNTGASTSNRSSSSGSSTTTSSKNKYENIVVFNGKYAAVAKNGKYGFIDEYDKLVIPFTYDYAENFFDGRALVELNGLYGYINTSGRVVIPLIYAKAERFENYTAKVEKGNERYKIYPDGKTASTPTLIDPNKKRKVSYDYKSVYDKGIALVRNDSKYGLVDLSDNIVITALYEDISPSLKGNKTEAKLNGKWGVVNTRNEVVMPFIYDKIRIDGLFYTAVLDNKWGTIDSLGKIISPFKYETIERFEKGLAPVQLNKKWGYIDEKGKIIIPIKYDFLGLNSERFEDLLFVVGLKYKMGVINKVNKIMIPLIYDKVTISKYYAYITATLKSKDFFFDFQGKSCVRSGSCEQHQHKIYPDGKTASTPTEINPTPKNKVESTIKVDYKGTYRDGIALVIINSKEGYVDLSDKVVIPAIYDNLLFFEPLSNKVEAQLNGKWGIIDRNNKVIIPFIYDHINLDEGVTRACLNNKWGTIDSLGKTIIPFIYEKMDHFTTGLALVQLNEKWGYVDEKGNAIIPIKYDQAINFIFGGRYNDELFVVGMENKFGVINKANEIILPLIYDKVKLKFIGDIGITAELGFKTLDFDRKGKLLN